MNFKIFKYKSYEVIVSLIGIIAIFIIFNLVAYLNIWWYKLDDTREIITYVMMNLIGIYVSTYSLVLYYKK